MTLKNPILPSKINDGIVIPECSLYVFCSFNGIKDKIQPLIKNAIELLKEAKKNHDELESYYIKAMDFEALNRFGEKTINKILAL